MATARVQTYDRRDSQPCLDSCEIDKSMISCEQDEKHTGCHRADFIDKRGNAITITWRKRRG